MHVVFGISKLAISFLIKNQRYILHIKRKSINSLIYCSQKVYIHCVRTASYIDMISCKSHFCLTSITSPDVME